MAGNNARCQAPKADGSPCQATPLSGSRFCFFHDPDRANERQAGRQAGGRTGRAATLPTDSEFMDIKTSADVVVLLSDTINRVRVGEIDPRVGNCVGYLAGVVMKALEQGEAEERLKALEAAVDNRPRAGSLFALEPEALDYDDQKATA